MIDTLADLLPPFGAILAADALRYLLPASAAYGLLWVGLRSWSRGRQLGPRPPEGTQMRREFAWSMASVLIFALSGLGIYVLAQAGVFEIYGEVNERGWAWWLTSVAILIIAHDAYFYAVHRLLHRPWWFRHVHRVHHRSVHPSPWAAYAFHPAEAALMAGFLPLALVAMPLHGGAIFVFLAHMIVRNVLGHSGVALTARNAIGRWYGRHFTTTLHHHLHHSEGGGHYGLYFRHLDRWFKTERADYAGRLDRHLDQRRASRSTAEGAA